MKKKFDRRSKPGIKLAGNTIKLDNIYINLL